MWISSFRYHHLPEAGETVVGENYEVLHGGKGANQAVAAAKAGATVEMVGCVGSDSFGHEAIQALRESGVGVTHVRAVDGPTGCAAIGVDTEGNNQILVAAGANGHVGSGLFTDALIGCADTVLLQMEVPPEANWQVIRRIKETEARIILNAAPATGVPDDVLPLLDLLVVNALEAQAVAEAAGLDSSDPSRCGRTLAERFGIPVAVTLGAKGSLLFDADTTLTVPRAPDHAGRYDGRRRYLLRRAGRGPRPGSRSVRRRDPGQRGRNPVLPQARRPWRHADGGGDRRRPEPGCGHGFITEMR